jgi:serine/threonine-protein kinase
LAADFPSRRDFRHDLAHSQNNLGLLLGAMGRIQEAEAVCADAVAICKQLVVDFPDVPDYRNQLGGALVNLASLANDRRDFSQARRWLEEAQQHLQQALKANPRHPEYRQFYRGQLQVSVKCHAGLGDTAGAEQAANRLRDLGGLPATDAYDAAVALARCVPIGEKGEQPNPEALEKQKQFYADKAMTTLQRAVAAGYKDAANLRKNTDLDTLRSREDFQKLLAELER